MLEKDFEKLVCERIYSLGGIPYKWTSPNCVGVPDRLCVMPNGRVIFIEVKRPSEPAEPRGRQKKVITDLRRLGHMAWVINDINVLNQKLEENGFEV